jgi:hypothetical protein
MPAGWSRGVGSWAGGVWTGGVKDEPYAIRVDALCEAQRNATLRVPFINSTLYVETRDYQRAREVCITDRSV